MNSRRPKALLCWSSGKDSAWALYTLRQQGKVDIVGLLTTINQPMARVAMHAVREELLEAQARAICLPLLKVYIPDPCSNDQYEKTMAEVITCAKADGITVMAFGDLFLEDVRKYRENMLAGTGITPIFPVWGTDTTLLSREMVKEGLKAYVTCVDSRQLDASFSGRAYDKRFLDDLPHGVDPCGERGEFHTFVYDGPMFKKALSVVLGEILQRDGFQFSDVYLAASQKS